MDDVYLIGDRMLVAPLFAGESQRVVKLPKGMWHDFWTGIAVEGGQTTPNSASTAAIPVFVKAGSVFPVAGIGDSSDSPAARELTVRVYGDGSLPWNRNGRAGLSLSWDKTSQKGKVSAGASNPDQYRVVSWKQMG